MYSMIFKHNGISLEKVDKFCYLGDMFDADVIQQ